MRCHACRTTHTEEQVDTQTNKTVHTVQQTPKYLMRENTRTPSFRSLSECVASTPTDKVTIAGRTHVDPDAIHVDGLDIDAPTVRRGHIFSMRPRQTAPESNTWRLSTSTTPGSM